jgi:RNA polymerase sigma-70 factor, ECF subfamily
MQNGTARLKFPVHRADGHHDSCDEGLVARVAAGDRLAMKVLYERHHVRVYRFVLRLVNNAAIAEDLTSDVFLDIWKHAGHFEGRSEVSTWILSIARHKAISTLRRRANEQLDDEITRKIPDSDGDPEAILQKRNEDAVLRQRLTRLSPAHREIIDLVYYHEKSIAEVAEIIGVPQNTVKTRMFYARKRLAALLGKCAFHAAA